MKLFHLFVLTAALALQSETALFAAPPKPVCVCGDECKCKLGDCPGKCPVAAKRDLDAANAAVARGEKVVLCLGVPAVDGAYACGPIKGHADGVYDCWKQADGKHMMQLRVAAASSAGTYCVNGTCYSPGVVQRGIVQPTYGLSPSFQSCPNGQCESPKRRR